MMRKNLRNKAMAGLLAFATVVSSGSIFSMPGGKASAADNTPLTKVLGAEDIDLRVKWNDKSNIGEGREITLSDGRKLTIKDNGTMRPELTSQQLADTEMGVGINLGNTLEATHSIDYKNTVNGTDFDTAWGQKPTTRAYIDCLHSYGINTFRIPVAWSNADVDDGTYTIRPSLLDRVEEVANYALDNGMYVIINDHWDNQWKAQFGACKKDADGNKVADEEMRAAAWERYERYWTQICERFKDYSDHVIFEGANEEMGTHLNAAICVNGPAKGYAKPGNAGKDIEAVTGNLKTDELYDTVNKINQKFVDIVRASGGNNASRHLLIPGYDTNVEACADSRFVMPKDTEANGTSKLFLSVHYYVPTEFALDNGTGTYTPKDQEYTKEHFKGLQKFNDAGYAVIIGECGFCNPAGVSGSVTQWFYDTYKEAAKYHAVPVLWDTGAFFNREEAKLIFKDIAIFYNTINQVNGSTDMDKITGGGTPPEEADSKVPAYLDKELWATPGMHAYLSYQSSTFDYRNAYQPLSSLKKNVYSWNYIQAAGIEVPVENTKVTDVQLTADGEYTILIDGIDLSGANSFQMLGIATDIDKTIYPGITVTDATVKFDGQVIKESATLVDKPDNDYYFFMFINKYDKKLTYPLGEENEKETLKMPTKSIEISFKINGLEKPLADITSGEYIDHETGEKIGPGTNVPNPPATEEPSTYLEKGATFTSGNFKYKVTKAVASDEETGAVTLTGLAKKGASAKKLSVGNTVKGSDGVTYTINAIGSKAFSGAKATSITLNKNIKSIPASAFAKCQKLSSLTLKAKLTKVTKNAFNGCKKTITVKGTSKKANLKLLKKTSYKKFK